MNAEHPNYCVPRRRVSQRIATRSTTMRFFLTAVAAAVAAAAAAWPRNAVAASVHSHGAEAEPWTVPTQAEYAYLTRYGYIQERAELAALKSPQAARQAVRKFQLMAGLPPTGYLDGSTRHKMRQPRCGLPDVRDDEYDRESVDGDGGIPAAYVLPGGRWTKRMLTWRITKYTDDMPRSALRQAVTNAFQVWQEAADIDIRETYSNEPDINIQFAPGEHGDRYPFDGPGGVLAHAFYPQSGAVHFDDGEEWTTKGSGGINVERVAAHEFGHTLGLGHSSAPGALMSPYYSFLGESYSLSDDDVRGIQALYGKAGSIAAAAAAASTTTTTAAAPTTAMTSAQPTARRAAAGTTTPGRSLPDRRVFVVSSGVGGGVEAASPVARQPDPCKARLDDVTQWLDGRTYAFKDDWTFRFRERDSGVEAGYPKRSVQLFYRFPSKPEAVVFSWRTRMLYVFKDKQVWKYSGYALVDGYPRRVGGYFPKLRAALSLPDGGLLLISDKFVYKWDEAHGALVSLSNNKGWLVSTYWKGAPQGIDAAYYDIHTRATLIFKGQTYYRYPDDLHGNLAQGYPRQTRTGWMGC